MAWWHLLVLSVGLGADVMSICMSAGVRWHGPRQKFRLAWHMGLFQALMPILGYSLGQGLAGFVAGAGRYLAAGILVAVGVKMLVDALRAKRKASGEPIKGPVREEKDPTRGVSLVALSLATSIDALVVGFSAGLREVNIWQMALVIGLVAGGMAIAGIVIGKRLGNAFGWYAELGGAVLLMALGVSFLWS